MNTKDALQIVQEGSWRGNSDVFNSLPWSFRRIIRKETKRNSKVIDRVIVNSIIDSRYFFKEATAVAATTLVGVVVVSIVSSIMED